jgi:hypothetical protein
MSTIVTRAGKGAPLTNTELDSNFTNLNTDKLEINAALGTPASVTLTNATGLPTAGLVDNAVTDAKLRDSAGLSVIGRGANSTGDPADIVAGTNKQVLRRDGSSLGFGAVDLSSNQAVTGTLPVNQGGTGITSFGSGVATWLGTPSSANLAAAVTDETGTGALVFANSPALVTPALGTPASGVVTNLTGTASININGTVGATTPAAGAFTTLNTSGAVVFNEAGANVDFRVEGDTEPNLLFVDASADNVGIGTSSPAQKLHISSASGTPSNVLLEGAVTTGSSFIFKNDAANQFTADRNFHLIDFITSNTSSTTTGGYVRIKAGQQNSGSDNATYMSFWTAPNAGTVAERLRINSAGNVGIGTSAPSEKLNVLTGTTYAAAFNTSVATSATTRLSIGAFSAGAGGSSGSVAIGALHNHTDTAQSWMLFYTHDGSGHVERMRITSTGDLGLGATTPVSLLEVQGGLTTTGAVVTLSSKETSTVANDVLGRVNFRAALDAAGGDAILTGASIVALAEGTFSSTSNATSLLFQTGSSEAATTKMTLTSAGNVGIGTSSPAAKLHVLQSAVSASWSPAVETALRLERSTAVLSIVSGNTSNASAINFSDTDAEKAGSIGYAHTSDAMTFLTASTERMRITSAGNVGIGTSSPSASAILDAQSTTKGVRMPNMTTTEKNAIASPAAGLMVYDTTLAKLCVYTTAWETITSL